MKNYLLPKEKKFAGSAAENVTKQKYGLKNN